MRILSQDGNIDILYKEASLCIDMGGSLEKGRELCIYARISNAETFFEMARYKTYEKAKKAMEMLREAYSPVLVIKEHQEGLKPNIKPNEFVVGSISPMLNVEVLDNFYFQFPADDEMEV